MQSHSLGVMAHYTIQATSRRSQQGPQSHAEPRGNDKYSSKVRAARLAAFGRFSGGQRNVRWVEQPVHNHSCSVDVVSTGSFSDPPRVHGLSVQDSHVLRVTPTAALMPGALTEAKLLLAATRYRQDRYGSSRPPLEQTTSTISLRESRQKKALSAATGVFVQRSSRPS